jgi:hypothetical protein
MSSFKEMRLVIVLATVVALLALIACEGGSTDSSPISPTAAPGTIGSQATRVPTQSSGGGSDTRCEKARDRLDEVRHALGQLIEIDDSLFVALRHHPESLPGNLLNQESSLEEDVKKYC